MKGWKGKERQWGRPADVVQHRGRLLGSRESLNTQGVYSTLLSLNTDSASFVWGGVSLVQREGELGGRREAGFPNREVSRPHEKIKSRKSRPKKNSRLETGWPRSKLRVSNLRLPCLLVKLPPQLFDFTQLVSRWHIREKCQRG